jgi:hypothetical protein
MYRVRSEDAQVAGGMEEGSGSSAGSSQHCCPSAGMVARRCTRQNSPMIVTTARITAISAKWDSSAYGSIRVHVVETKAGKKRG